MATRTAVSEIKLNFKSTIKNLLTGSVISSTLSVGKQVLSGQIETGVSASQANRAFERRSITITSGNTEDIDLYDLGSIDLGAGAGMDGLGQAWVAEEIVTLIIHQVGGDTGARLEIMPSSPTGALAWAPSLTVANGGALRAGALMMLHSTHTEAFDINDGVSHVLRLKANGGDAIYDIFVLARHDDDESSSSSSSSVSSQSSSSSSKSCSSLSSQSTSSSSVSSSSGSSQSTSSESSSSSSCST